MGIIAFISNRPLRALTIRTPARYTRSCKSGSSSVVECFLAKEDVAGSTPVSRSKKVLPAVHFTYNSTG